MMDVDEKEMKSMKLDCYVVNSFWIVLDPNTLATITVNNSTTTLLNLAAEPLSNSAAAVSMTIVFNVTSLISNYFPKLMT